MATKPTYEELEQRVKELEKEVVERKRSEEALQRREKELRIIAENVPALFSYLDKDGYYRFTNKRYEEWFGLSQTDIVGKNYRQVLGEATYETIEDHVNRVLSGERVRYEEALPYKHGGTRYVIADYIPDTDESGKVNGFFALVIDVTELKRGEKALRESDKKYRSLFELMLNGFAYCKMLYGKDKKPIDWIYLDVNDAFEKITGLTKEIIGKQVTEAIPGITKDVPQLFETYGKVALTGETARFEIYLDTLKIWFSVMAYSPRKDYFVSIFEDITDRKQAEEALRESEEKYRTVLESNPDPVVVYDMEGRVIYLNPAFTRVFGWSLEEQIGKKIDDFVPEENWPETRMMIDKVTVSGESFSGLETRRYTKEGNILDISISGSCYRDQEGNVAASVINLRDITKQQELQAQFLHSQKMEGIGRLAGGVAHDFNNLLMIIIGYGELVFMGLRKDDPLRENVKEINRAAKSAASLTRQLMAFSRKQILKPRVLDFNEVVTNLKKMLGRIIGEDVELETALAPDLGLVEVDEGQMEQVIINLAVNAKDAMPQGGKLTLETATVYLDEEYARRHGVKLKHGPHVMLEMSDTGVGMDEETQAKIFEPFFTTKELGKGTGLGMATVYGIIKQSGGDIWVYSEPGGGTTFKIYLPVVEGKTEPEQKGKIVLEGLRGSETVLLVEDEKSVLDLVRDILQRYGYSVLEAQNGEEALNISNQHEGPIHLMLTDAVMPGMSGRELAERAQSLRPEIKILYMSGHTDDAIAHHGVLAPGVNFIEKPFVPEDLVRKLRQVLDEK